MEEIKYSISPEELAKFKEREGRMLESVEIKKFGPEGNRHDRRAAEKRAELERRIKALSP